MISISNKIMKKNMFEEVINFTEDSLVGAQDENSLEEIRSPNRALQYFIS